MQMRRRNSSTDAEESAAAPTHKLSRWALLLTAIAVCVVGGVGAFGLNSRSTPKAWSPTTVSTTVPATTPVTLPVVTHPVGLIAALSSTVSAQSSPGGLAVAPVAATWHGSPALLPVIATQAGYLEVRLPTRPNGSTAWIPAAGIRLFSTPYSIVLNLATRHLLVYRDGVLKFDMPAGVGTPSDPTPTGQFFVAFFAVAPSAAWGSFLMVTSAHSNAITDWEASGDALVAIHGPLGEDSEIGTTGAQISHGCIRLHDSDLAKLRVVPDGSPIDIIR